MITHPGLLATFIILGLFFVVFFTTSCILVYRIYRKKYQLRLKKYKVFVPTDKDGHPSLRLRILLWFRTITNQQTKADIKKIKEKYQIPDLPEEEPKQEGNWFEELSTKLTELITNNLEVKRLFSKSNIDITDSIPEQLKRFPEEIVRAKTIFLLNEKYNIDYEQMEFELPVRIGSKNYFVDISLFPKKTKHILEHALIHFECKRASASPEILEEGISQLKSYMQVSPVTKYGIVTNGDNEKMTFFEKNVSLSGTTFTETKNFLKDFDFRIPSSMELNKEGDLDW